MNAKERRYVASLENRISILESERRAHYDEWLDRGLDKIDMANALQDVSGIVDELRERLMKIEFLWR